MTAHAKTGDYIDTVEKPKVITHANVLKAIEAFDAKLGLLSQQATIRLAALNAADARETDVGVRAHFEEARQKLKAIIRLCAETDQRTTDLLNAHRELDAHTARLKGLADADG